MKYRDEELFEEDYEDEIDRMRSRRRSPNELRSRKVPETPTRRRSHRKSFRIKGIWKLAIFAVIFLSAFGIYQHFRGDQFWTVAVFGVDSRNGSTGAGALSDVEILCSINQKTGEVRLASVYRDSYLRIRSDGTYHKINEAYFKGGADQAVSALEDNLDLEIDDYATFNWKAVVDAINILGGVDVDITDKEFAYINSFITETVESTGVGSVHLENSGINHLDGVQAVAYARLRLMDTDFQRTERQRKIITLAMEKAKSADFKTLRELAVAIYPQIATSVGLDDMISVARNAKKYYLGETTGFPFSHEEVMIGKMSCVVPTTLESNAIQLHTFLYDDTQYTPSSTLKQINSYIMEKTGLTNPGNNINYSLNPSNNETKESSAGKAPETSPVQEQTTEVFTETTEEETIEAFESSDEESSHEEFRDEFPDESTETPDTENEESSSPTIPTEDFTQGPGTETAPTPDLEESRPSSGIVDAPGADTEETTPERGPGVEQ